MLLLQDTISKQTKQERKQQPQKFKYPCAILAQTKRNRHKENSATYNIQQVNKQSQQNKQNKQNKQHTHNLNILAQTDKT